jgi:two-component system sensor histidine kinase QseC
VTGQAEWLRVLIRNLVDNAIRYTPPGSQLQVAIADCDGCCRLRSSDSGPGSGLGLAIVARIAELHVTDLELSTAKVLRGLQATVIWK